VEVEVEVVASGVVVEVREPLSGVDVHPAQLVEHERSAAPPDPDLPEDGRAGRVQTDQDDEHGEHGDAEHQADHADEHVAASLPQPPGGLTPHGAPRSGAGPSPRR
jgi:hypothetical protein